MNEGTKQTNGVNLARPNSGAGKQQSSGVVKTEIKENPQKKPVVKRALEQNIVNDEQKIEIEKLKIKSSESTRANASSLKDINISQVKKQRPQTAKYTRSFVQDDSCLIQEYDENDKIVLTFKENKLIRNLRLQINNKHDPNEDELNPQLDYENLKLMYMSFDGGKLTSTLVNLDIEEMCFCFACAILKHIERGEQLEIHSQPQPTQPFLPEIEEEHEEHFYKDNISNKHENESESEQEQEQEIENDSNQLGQQPLAAGIVDSNAFMNPIQNDSSFNRTANLVEEPTLIQDDYRQSILNADAEKYYSKDNEYSEQNNEQKALIGSNSELNWKQKKSLSNISERTHEGSHQQKSMTVENSVEQSQNARQNISSNRKQFESSRQEMEDILKESLLIKVRDNQSLSRRLEVENHENEKDLEYTEEEEEGEQEDDEEEEQEEEDYHNEREQRSKGIKNQKERRRGMKFEEDRTEKDITHEKGNEIPLKCVNSLLGSGIKISGYSEGLDPMESYSEVRSKEQVKQQQYSFRESYKDEGDEEGEQEEVQSEGEVEEENNLVADESQVGQDSGMLNFSTISRYSMVMANDENSNRRLFDQTYNFRENTDVIFAQKPTKENVQNYCKNVCISCQLEKQIPIIALVYIERLLERSGFTVTAKNWRKITLTAMIMASKIWDDESFENQNFSQAFPQFDVVQINEMERVFLNFIDYNLYVKGADYAKYYFILREFAQKNKKSFPLRPLDLKTILFLQNNANRVQNNLRELYHNPLNKSF